MTTLKTGYIYGSRPLWQWLALYIVAAGILYGLFFYFVLRNPSASTADTGTGANVTTVEATQPTLPY